MAPSNFSTDEVTRYSRHFVLPGFGVEAQKRLKASRVAVIGAGGLGAPALYYLAAAGVGTIGIFDADTVSLSNLQRQILFKSEDIGQSKAKRAATRLAELNNTIRVEVFDRRVTRDNAMELLTNFDILVDATDNFPARYLLNDVSVLLNKPLVYGSVFRFEGQVAVFNHKGSCTYRDLYPEPPLPGSVPDCEQGGVLGVLPGIVGCYQASETIKIATDLGEPLTNQVLMIDLLTMENRVIRIADQNKRAIVQGLVDYEHFCGLTSPKKDMKEVTVQQLKELIDTKSDFQLIDVREPHEFDTCNLGGELIPQAEIPHNVDRISRDKQVVIHCRSGARSGNMVQWLEKNHGFTNLYNLKGGILAWADQIDPTMPKY